MQIHYVFVSGEPHEIVERAGAAGAHVYDVSEQVLRAVSDATTPQGIVAVAELPESSLSDLDLSTGLVLVLAEIRDPGNGGTLVRSAAASGCGVIVFTTGSVDPFAPKTLRAAAGAMFRTPVVTRVELKETLQFLKDAGFSLVLADARSEVSLYDVELTGPTAIVLGNESWGVPEGSSGHTDVAVGIPMPGGVESLNVGVAGSLFLFEAARQRQVGSAAS